MGVCVQAMSSDLKRTHIYGSRYVFRFPPHLAHWDVWSQRDGDAGWERERIASAERTLKQGDICFDIGAEQGALSLMYAEIVGGSNLVLFEPEPAAWRCLKQIWEANRSDMPLACYVGLLGTNDVTPEGIDYDTTSFQGSWPAVARQPGDCGPRAYRYLHEHSDTTAQTRLDTWVESTGIVPDALTIDVEGAEFEVLSGAVATLTFYQPIVWCSIHPDLMRRDYGTTPGDVNDLMSSLGYYSKHLATDHECHWAYYHPDGRELK